MDEPIILRYRNRDIRNSDLDFIRSSIKKHFAKGRTRISQILCEAWCWRQANGRLKEYACRDLLLRLEEWGHISLPPRQSTLYESSRKRTTHQLDFSIVARLVTGADLSKIVVRPIVRGERPQWKSLMEQHHYLGNRVIVGEHILYGAYLKSQMVACLAWGSAAMRSLCREAYIGWDENTKKQNLCFVVNNIRFLILPWVKIKNLASRVLSLNLKRLSCDWQRVYAHPVYLAETFVDPSRFKGTCYQAANWIELGKTKGLSKKGNQYISHGKPKILYVYPLHPRAKELLSKEHTP